MRIGHGLFIVIVGVGAMVIAVGSLGLTLTDAGLIAGGFIVLWVIDRFLLKRWLYKTLLFFLYGASDKDVRKYWDKV